MVKPRDRSSIRLAVAAFLCTLTAGCGNRLNHASNRECGAALDQLRQNAIAARKEIQAMKPGVSSASPGLSGQQLALILNLEVAEAVPTAAFETTCQRLMKRQLAPCAEYPEDSDSELQCVGRYREAATEVVMAQYFGLSENCLVSVWSRERLAKLRHNSDLTARIASTFEGFDRRHKGEANSTDQLQALCREELAPTIPGVDE